MMRAIKRIRSWGAPGTRLVGFCLGLLTAIVYLLRPPGSPGVDFPGTGAQVIATLLLALVFERAFSSSSMRLRDARAGFLTLLFSVVALAVAAITAAGGQPFRPLTGAVVLGATIALTWTVLTDVLEELRLRSLGRDGPGSDDGDVWC